MKMEKTNVFIVTALMIFLVIVNNVVLLVNVYGEQSTASQIQWEWTGKYMIESIYKNVSVKSFGGDVYLLELIPLRVYKGLIVMEGVAAPYFIDQLEGYVQLLIMKFENITDPFTQPSRRSACPDELLSLLNASGFKSFCAGPAFPYIVVYAPPRSEQRLEETLRVFASMRMNGNRLTEEVVPLGTQRVRPPYVFVYRIPMSYEEAEKKLEALIMLRNSADIAPRIANASNGVQLQGSVAVYNETYKHLYERDPVRLLFSWTVSGPPPGGVIVHCPYYSPCYGREDEVLDVIAEGVKLAGVDPSGIVVVFGRNEIVTLIDRDPSKQPPTFYAEPLKKVILSAAGLSFSAACIALAVALLRRGKPK